MKRHISNFFGGLLVMSGLLMATAAGRAQMMGGSPAGAQNGSMNQQGMSPTNMPQNGPMGAQNNGPMGAQNNSQGAEQNLFGNIRRNAGVETELSKMALKNSQNEDIKKFAQQTITENRKLGSQLALPSATNGPSFPMPVPDQTRKAEKQMKKLSGPQFDQMYLVQMAGYIKNDQQLAATANGMNNAPDAGAVGMQLRTLSDTRANQIAQLSKKENLIIK